MQLTTRIPFTSATLLITAAASGFTQTVPRPDQRVEASSGVVAAAHPLAARAGLDMLRSGGNAVDAAIATAFAVGVVEPMMSGIGGGGSLTLWLDSARTAWHVEFYPSSPGSPDYALDSVDEDEAIRDSLVPPERWAAVPGAVAGLLATHERFGRLPRETVLAPAIRLARGGFPVHALLGAVIVEAREKLQYDPRARELFFPEGVPLQPGDTLRQPDLATTLELIAREGRDGFYRGPVAEEVVAALRRGENPITLADLAAFEPRWRRPLCGTYRGFTVLSAPPPLAGSEVVQTLALLEPFDLPALGLPIANGDALAAVVDAIRVARTDYDRWIGDPRDVGVPAIGMASAEYADERRALVGIAAVPDTLAPGDPWDEERTALPDACALAGAFPPTTLPRAEDEPMPAGPSGEDAQTTHLSVIDADGNAVSLTYTLGLYFGSGAYAAGAFYNTAAANFGGPAANRRGPFRAPRSSTTPTLVLEDGRIRMAVGSPASGRIAPAIVHTILYTLDYGLDPWTAVAMPRVYPFFNSREVRLEMGFAAEALAELSGRGYELTVRPAYDMYFGGVHVVLVSDDGTLIGAADPRREGVAVGY
jgi:gamma-glutamyltranspeptidase/glutathione hydrolase